MGPGAPPPVSSSTPVRPAARSATPASALNSSKAMVTTDTQSPSAARVAESLSAPRRSPRKGSSLSLSVRSAQGSHSGNARAKLNFRDHSSSGGRAGHKLTTSSNPKLTHRPLSLEAIETSSKAEFTTEKKLLKGHSRSHEYRMSYVNTTQSYSKVKRMKSPARRSAMTAATNSSGNTFEERVSNLSEDRSQCDSGDDFELPRQMQKKRRCDFSPTKSRTHIVPTASGSRTRKSSIKKKSSFTSPFSSKGHKRVGSPTFGRAWSKSPRDGMDLVGKLAESSYEFTSDDDN